MTNEVLAILAKDGDQAARNQLWERSQGLLVNMLRRYFGAGSKHGLTDKDILQHGFFIVIRAVEGYNSDKGYTFNTYLRYSAQNEMRELFGYRSMDAKLREDGPVIVSGNAPLGDDGRALQDVIPDETAPAAFEEVEITDTQRAVQEELEKLPALHQEAIRLHYLEGHTLQRVGTLTGTTTEAVRQKCVAGMRKLRKSMGLQELYFDYQDHYTASRQRRYKNVGLQLEAQRMLDAIERRQRQRIEEQRSRGKYISYGKEQAAVYAAQERFLNDTQPDGAAGVLSSMECHRMADRYVA